MEDRIAEATQNVEDAKETIATAITNMNQSANSSLTFSQLADKIEDISNDADAAVSNVLSTKTFYQGGTKKTGTMPNNGVLTLTPGTSQVTIPTGYAAPGSKVVGEANLLAANIVKDFAIFGVTGSAFRMKQGNFVSSPSSTLTVSDLGFQPQYVLIRHAKYTHPNLYYAYYFRFDEFINLVQHNIRRYIAPVGYPDETYYNSPTMLSTGIVITSNGFYVNELAWPNESGTWFAWK